MLKRKDKIILSALFAWLVSPSVFVPVLLNHFQLFEMTENLFVYAFASALFASNLFIRKLLTNVKASGFTALSLEFFIWGFTFTVAGIITAITALSVSVTGFKHGLGELLNFYAQLSLNFLIGGVTLVGASLPVLHSLFGQSESKVEPSPQSGGCGEEDMGRDT